MWLTLLGSIRTTFVLTDEEIDKLTGATASANDVTEPGQVAVRADAVTRVPAPCLALSLPEIKPLDVRIAFRL